RAPAPSLRDALPFLPLPHALDQDQLANASVLQDAGGAIRIIQAEFTPERLARELEALATDPLRLGAMAHAAKASGTLDAAEQLRSEEHTSELQSREK